MNALVIPVAAASALSAAILLPVGAFEDMLIIPMFEGVVLLSSVFALLTAVGRFPRGPGLSLLCCGVFEDTTQITRQSSTWTVYKAL